MRQRQHRTQRPNCRLPRTQAKAGRYAAGRARGSLRKTGSHKGRHVALFFVAVVSDNNRPPCRGSRDTR